MGPHAHLVFAACVGSGDLNSSPEACVASPLTMDHLTSPACCSSESVSCTPGCPETQCVVEAPPASVPWILGLQARGITSH